MFDYKYTVKSSDGYEWGLFKTKAQAELMRNALIQNFETEFWVIETGLSIADYFNGDESDNFLQ